VAIVFLRWGNWGCQIGLTQRAFTHRLTDEAQVDVVYGHSSNYFRGIEVYKRKLILYGFGNFINNYKGIDGHEEFRDD
jgi:poly-gamma-glutamate capsule biosynthesis protein CapA/YwtB (metallophosphatase superfamily)